jgi:hypothetical protein
MNGGGKLKEELVFHQLYCFKLFFCFIFFLSSDNSCKMNLLILYSKFIRKELRIKKNQKIWFHCLISTSNHQLRVALQFL